MKNYLAIDIGGSKLMAGILREDGVLMASEKFAWGGLEKDVVFGTILDAARDITSKHPQYECLSAGATIPGLTDPEAGVWVEASFSGIRNFCISEEFRAATGLDLAIENDANACALAENMFGAAAGVDDFVYFTISNGCGGALFLNGALYAGGLGNAGEFGHVVVTESGRPCGCGSRGCFEMHASGRALAMNYAELCGTSAKDADAREIASRARGGEARAIETYETEGRYIGRVAAMAANILNPGLIVIGGGVSLSFDLFEPEMRRVFKEQTYGRACGKTAIKPAGLGYEGALVAAGALAMRKQGENGGRYI